MEHPCHLQLAGIFEHGATHDGRGAIGVLLQQVEVDHEPYRCGTCPVRGLVGWRRV
jgi:hypothetical protein